VNTTTQSFAGSKTFHSSAADVLIPNGGIGVTVLSNSGNSAVELDYQGIIKIFGDSGGPTPAYLRMGSDYDTFQYVYAEMASVESLFTTTVSDVTHGDSGTYSLFIDHTNNRGVFEITSTLGTTCYAINSARGVTVNWNKVSNSSLTIIGGIITGYA
jgi:hypothetical protein